MDIWGLTLSSNFSNVGRSVGRQSRVLGLSGHSSQSSPHHNIPRSVVTSSCCLQHLLKKSPPHAAIVWLCNFDLNCCFLKLDYSDVVLCVLLYIVLTSLDESMIYLMMVVPWDLNEAWTWSKLLASVLCVPDPDSWTCSCYLIIVCPSASKHVFPLQGLVLARKLSLKARISLYQFNWRLVCILL